MTCKYFFVLALLFHQTFVKAQSFVPTDKGSDVKFKIKNFGLVVNGTFKGLEGKIEFDANDISKCQFDVSVNANTIDTEIKMRDNHLRKEEYLDVKKYSRIRFTSSKITPGKSGGWVITGALTIKNVTKEIAFPFTYEVMNGAPAFKGEFEINRRNFGVGGSSISMADNLTVLLRIETVKK
ncbi:MAG: YceI family protein [Bacteroidetes bacterium]|nr:YceI family protein [Bacteroidota bacterium]